MKPAGKSARARRLAATDAARARTLTPAISSLPSRSPRTPDIAPLPAADARGAPAPARSGRTLVLPRGQDPVRPLARRAAVEHRGRLGRQEILEERRLDLELEPADRKRAQAEDPRHHLGPVVLRLEPLDPGRRDGVDVHDHLGAAQLLHGPAGEELDAC